MYGFSNPIARLVIRVGAPLLTTALACNSTSPSTVERSVITYGDGGFPDAPTGMDASLLFDADIPMPIDADIPMPIDADIPMPIDAGMPMMDASMDADIPMMDASMPMDAGGGGGLCCELHGGLVWNPNTEHRLLCRVSTTITTEEACIAANGGVKPVYRVFHLDNPASDQSAVMPGQRSGLVTRDAVAPLQPWILDDWFAQMFASSVDAAIINAQGLGQEYEPKLMFDFSQCFGGGMIDDLVHSFLAIPTIQDVPMLLTSASRFDQTSFYPSAATPTDWAWALTGEISAGTASADALSWEAAENDDYRKNNMEEPQVAFFNWGEDIDIRAEQPRGIAILWSGQPKRVDGEQIAQLVQALNLAHGYNANQIFVFYGDGVLPANHVIRQAQLVVGNFVISRASEPQLAKLLDTAFQGLWPNAPGFVFFFANDHGYSTVANAATPRQGGDPDNQDDLDAYGDLPPYGEPDFEGEPPF